MAYTIIGKDPISQLPKRLSQTDAVIVGQIELTSATPIIIQPNTPTIANLDADKLQGYSANDLKTQALTDKKILISDYNKTFSSVQGSASIDVSDLFISNGQEEDYAFVENVNDEGYIILNTATNSYESVMILDNNGKIIKDPNSGGTVYGVLKRNFVSDNGVSLSWTTGSNTINWAGNFTVEPLGNYTGKYISGPDGKLYKIMSITDNGDNTGTFVLTTTYNDVTASNNLSYTQWEVVCYEDKNNNVFVFNVVTNLRGVFTKRANLKTMPEDYIKLSDLFIIDKNEGGSNVSETTPFVVNSENVSYDAATLVNAIDLFKLTNNFVIQSDTTNALGGVTISIGNINDTISLTNVLTTTLDTASLSIGGTQLMVSISTLNQLAGLNTGITGARVNKLFDGNYTDEHQHVVAFTYATGTAIGDVVTIDSNNIIRRASAASATTYEYKVYGVLVGIDSINNIGYVLKEGTAPIASGVAVNDGDEVFLSNNYPGKYQNSAPNTVGSHVIRIGYINNNKLYLDIDYITQL